MNPTTHAEFQPALMTRPTGRSPLRWAALLSGLFFLVFGAAGFMPGATLNFDSIEMAARSEAMLLGIFQVSVLHNVVHLLFGALGLTMSRSSGSARLFLMLGGIINAVIGIYGLLIDRDSTANFLPLNLADIGLSFVLAIVMIGLSLLSRHAEPRAGAVERHP